MTPETLTRALHASTLVDEFIVQATRSEKHSRALHDPSLDRVEMASSLEASIYIDKEQGRGHSDFSLTPGQDVPRAIADTSLRAQRALGPAWRLQPPSAPARVTLHTRHWFESPRQSLSSLVETFVSSFPTSLTLITGEVSLQRSRIGATTSHGFDNHYRRTEARFSALVQAKQGVPVSLVVRACRNEDFSLEEVFGAAEQRSETLAQAGPLEAGPADVLLLSSAYQPRHCQDYGIWTALVRQCDVNLAAMGMTRYKVGQELVKVRGDLLTLHSEGARDFALRSAPFDKYGQATRNFSLVDKGHAAGYAVGENAVARSGQDANGGVRNLLVEPGTHSLDALQEPRSRRLLVVHQVSDLQADASGGLLLRLGHAEERYLAPSGQLRSRPTQGGVLSGNLYHWLQDLQLAQESEDQLWCRGAAAMRFNNLQVHL